MRNQLERATHYVTKETVLATLLGPTPTGRWAVFYATSEGKPGKLHHENPMEYGADPVWTFVPDDLPPSAYALNVAQHVSLQANRIPRCKIRREARDRLARAARQLRKLRGTKAEKSLSWEPSPEGELGMLRAKVGSGWLILWEPKRHRGVNYTSSFGASSEKSFSGYLPGLTLEEAKKLVYHDAAGHW